MSSGTPSPDLRRIIDLGSSDTGDVTYTLSPGEFLRVESAACNCHIELADVKLRARAGCTYTDQTGVVVARAATSFVFEEPLTGVLSASFGFGIGGSETEQPSIGGPATATAGLADTVLHPYTVVTLFVVAFDKDNNNVAVDLLNGALWVLQLDEDASLLTLVNPLLVPIPLSEQLVAA